MKKINIIYILSFLLSISLFSACDIIEAPYLDNPQGQKTADELCLEAAQQADPFGPASPPIIKKVLFEEMTGHQCGNCPEATEKLAELKAGNLGDRIIAVGIHAGPLAQVKSSGKYATDFRTGPGDELYSALNVFDAVPLGLIDRTTLGLGASTWESKIQARLQEDPTAGISIFNCFDEEDLILNTVIDIKYLADATDQEHLAVYLVEDHILDWQKDYRLSDPDIESYSHEHVFRAAINGVWGAPVKQAGEQVKKDERFTFSYSFTLSQDFVPANCKVVAFVYRADSDNVGQAETASLLP